MKPSTPTIAFKEALKFWTKLGFISFGGPAGQIAIMHQEVVERRSAYYLRDLFTLLFLYLRRRALYRSHGRKPAAAGCAVLIVKGGESPATV